MDIHSLGSVASIISLVISFGFVLWSIIRKKKISFFSLYMSVVILIQVISVGFWLWHGKPLTAITAGMFLIFALLFWVSTHMSDKLLDIIQSHMEITKEMNQEIDEALRGILEIIKKLTIHTESKMNVNTKQLEDELKKIQKKIDKKKSNQ